MTNLPMATAAAASDATLQLVGFTVGSEEFGVDILKVQEIIRMVPVSAMPNAPDYVEGVINLRGRIIPVIDFRKRFQMATLAPTEEASRRVVVIALATSTIGLIVDSVSQVLKLKESQISPTPQVAKGFENDTIVGVGQLGEKLLVLLDLEQMFAGVEDVAQGNITKNGMAAALPPA